MDEGKPYQSWPDLLPCPRCGRSNPAMMWNARRFYVECDEGCGLIGPCSDKDGDRKEEIAALCWNRLCEDFRDWLPLLMPKVDMGEVKNRINDLREVVADEGTVMFDEQAPVDLINFIKATGAKRPAIGCDDNGELIAYWDEAGVDFSLIVRFDGKTVRPTALAGRPVYTPRPSAQPCKP